MASTDQGPIDLPSEKPIYGSRFNWSKVVAIISNVVVVIMILVSVGLCIGFGVKYDEPRYFLLLVNLLLSTVVSFIFLFWYYRGTLAQGLIWYIVLQSIFLFFQCVSTDVFAATAPQVVNAGTHTNIIPILSPTSTPNSSNSSSSSSSSSSSHTSGYAGYTTEYIGPIPTPPL
jgi:hypothetical protein